MSAEVLRESGSPIPAQKAARLPYETPTMEILLDSSVPYPRDPNFGASNNIGRFEPISPVVDTYAMSAQPKGLFDRTTARLGEIASRLAKPTVAIEVAIGGAGGAAVATIVQPQVPSAEASGGMLVTASAEGTSCVEDKNLLQIDFDYAAKLVKGIASGEIVIVIAGVPPIAALEEGDKTAAILPVEVTIEEALKNLIIPAPECPPVVEPTPFDGTVYMEAEINQNLDQIDTAVNFGTLTDDNDDLFATDAPWKEELASLNFWYPDDPSHPLKQKPWDTSLNTIKNGNPDLIKQHQSQKNIDKSKLDEVVGHAVEMAWVAQNATNPELIAELTTDIDHVIDYGAVGIYGKTVKGITKALGIIRSFFPGYANYLQ